MAMNGQATGGWTESVSSLRLLHVGIRNTNSELTDDAFTQSNPPVVTATNTLSTKVNRQVFGVLSGSVAFSRPDAGDNFVGGPVEGIGVSQRFVSPVGVFINNATGYNFVNQPGLASGRGPYVSALGTYGNATYETQALATTGLLAIGATLTYITGQELIASRNGYLMPRITIGSTGALVSADVNTIAAEVFSGATASTTIAVLRHVPDSSVNELVYDQRI